MVRIAFRRLWTNRRMIAGVLIGFIVAVAAASSIPVFTAGALQRVLQAELRSVAKLQPGAVHIAHLENPSRPTTAEQFAEADRVAREAGFDLIGLPIRPFVRYGALDTVAPIPVDPSRIDPDAERWVALAFFSDLAEHVEVYDGRPPAHQATDGRYEAMVTEEALEKLGLTLGAQLWVPVGNTAGAARVQVELVGAFRPKDPQDPYWFIGGPFEQQLFVAEQLFREELLTQPGARPFQYSWYYGLESQDVRVTDAIRLLGGLYELEARMAQAMDDTQLFDGPADLLLSYAQRASSLQLLLTLLAVPPLAVVAYFLVITSGMLVERQRQEIAVLRSRGASLAQVFLLYLLEGMLVAGGALLGGYPLGVLLARVMGAAAGFLQFVDRVQPPVMLSQDFWLYGLAAAALGVLAYVAPAMAAAGRSIVAFKQESARRSARPFWARFGLDLLCLGLAGYGWYTLSRRPGPGQVEPLHLLAPALFVIGAGLLALRLLPLLAHLLARLTDRRAKAPVWLALLQVSRASASYTPVILLLTLTVGMGLYSAAAARTLERNTADRIHYAGGADVVLEEYWDWEQPDPEKPARIVAGPPWLIHHDLPGVDHPARVRVEEVIPSVGGRAQRKATLMAIDPREFGQVAWFRPDLFDVHPFAYLNLLGRDEEAVLVSRPFMERNRLQPGDRVTLSNEEQADLSLVIYGAVDYWPSLDPKETDFFVAQYDFVEQNLGLFPHQVWLKMEPGARLQPVIDELKAQGVETTRADDHRQRLIRAMRDPLLNGLLGGLTNGFLLSAAITVLGFLLHAALSVRARQLQFGVLRAMGLSGTQLVLTVALEQALTGLVGVSAGTGLGLAAARLFVPFLQQGGQTPPFQVVSLPDDRVRLYMVLAAMLALALVGLMRALGRLRIHEAVKLGEDQ